ncbi:MAG: hypothetical protein WD627_01435 [Actinomycetota bacterium]
MRSLKTLAVVTIICLSPLAASTLARAGETPAQSEPARTTTTLPSRGGDTLDRFTSVAAVVSILIVGVAGVYIYRLIRKGL